MSNMKTINLADNINAAFDKVNENFDSLDSAVSNLDILDSAEVRAIITGSDLDMGGNKVLFGNVYSTVADLPSAGTYHGMFAHVHETGKGYFAHAGQWVELGGLDPAEITDIVNNILTEDYFLSVINEEYLQQFTINTSVDLTDVESGLSANASAILTLESRIDQTDSGITVLSQAQIATQAQLDGLVLGGIDEDVLASAITSANSTIVSRIDANSDSLVALSSIVDSVSAELLLLDQTTGQQIQAEAAARSALSSTVSLIDGKVTSTSNQVTNLTSRVDSDFATINQTLQTVVDDQGNASAVYALDLDVNNRIAGIKLENNGNSSQFSINADAFKVFNGTTDVPAFKVENGDVFLDQVSINTLTVGDLQGDINVITPFSGSGYRTWGPTSAGYKLLTTIDLPANGTPGIAHVPTISMAFSGIFKTDTAYIKLSMSKASTGLDNYSQIQVMRQRSTSGGSSWAVIPVVGAWSAPVSEDVRFKVEVKMYGDNGTNNTSASLGGTNYWSGTVAGLVGNVSNSLTTGGSTTTTAEDANVSGTVVDTNGNTVTLTEDQLNNYDYSNIPNVNIDFDAVRGVF